MTRISRAGARRVGVVDGFDRVRQRCRNRDKIVIAHTGGTLDFDRITDQRAEVVRIEDDFVGDFASFEQWWRAGSQCEGCKGSRVGQSQVIVFSTRRRAAAIDALGVSVVLTQLFNQVAESRLGRGQVCFGFVNDPGTGIAAQNAADRRKECVDVFARPSASGGASSGRNSPTSTKADK